MSPASSRVCLGVIVGVKGLRGEVRVKSFTEDPVDVAAYGPLATEDGRSFALTVSGAAQGAVIARIKGVADRNAAEALKGLKLYVERGALPAADDGSYYHADLVGLAAELVSGEKLGKVAGVFNFGAGDMIDVAIDEGRSELVPFNDVTIAEVDVAGGVIRINPVKGLFENDAEADAEERRKEEVGQEDDDT